MAKRNGNKKPQENYEPREKHHRLRPDTKKSIWGISFVGVAIILTLAGIGKAGPVGSWMYGIFDTLFGWGYFVLPLSLLLAAGMFFVSERQKIVGVTLLGVGIFILSVLGLIDLFSAGNGGWLGLILGSLKIPFGQTSALIINVVILFVSLLIILNVPIKLTWPQREKSGSSNITIAGGEEKTTPEPEKSKEDTEEKIVAVQTTSEKPKKRSDDIAPNISSFEGKKYNFPPISLLKSSTEKPTTGDLRANANIIKRTLDSFGISVEMGEINVGPTVTRYTLKPAEGMKLSRITALHQDLALALAAHPIRVEAPIPGKSLVGIEVPNRAAALVRLGSLATYEDFQKIGPLGFALGRDVSGEPVFVDIERMPHLLVAGATGSGKSVIIHSLITSLLLKNSPATLRLILIDPKRVELSIYSNIPLLVGPVITESKKAVGVFRWAISEMDRRYELLQQAGSRDVKGYNARGKDEPLPYIVIVVDELADLMTTYGREVEGSIVRLAQMARATGLHLVLSTQRPSVEVITGLIKANITNRIALQVASQIDSRTIIDASGAEKLLGNGDLLFVSVDLSKPKRIQGAYIPEEEVNKVVNFIRENNKGIEDGGGIRLETGNGNGQGQETVNGGGEKEAFDEFLGDEEDDLYNEAVNVVREAKKASASLLQRRLRVGYARAARLLDLMEANDLIGPGDGAKPREVFFEKMSENDV